MVHTISNLHRCSVIQDHLLPDPPAHRLQELYLSHRSCISLMPAVNPGLPDSLILKGKHGLYPCNLHSMLNGMLLLPAHKSLTRKHH